MQHSEPGNQFLQIERLYIEYAQAAETYLKRPTIYNWEEKEKAFETYNALLKNHKNSIKR